MRFMAVDPGLVNTGWAILENGELANCGLSTTKSKILNGRISDHYYCIRDGFYHQVVCERMVTRGKFSIVDAQDLIDLNLLAGALGNVWVTPNEWKGNVPRDVEQQRTWSALSGRERLLLPKLKSKSDVNHNVWSAVGIGLSVAQRAHKKVKIDWY